MFKSAFIRHPMARHRLLLLCILGLVLSSPPWAVAQQTGAQQTGAQPAPIALQNQAADLSHLQPLNFIPMWVPQAQFAGYFVALEKGFYAKFGLAVTILPGGPGGTPSELLHNGQAQVGMLFLSKGIVEYASGSHLINIAQVVQNSSLMLIARKDSGITEVKDLQGKRVGLWGPEYQVQARALFRKYNITVTVVPQSVSVNLFLRRGVDVASAMWHNEYHTIISSGMDSEQLTVIKFDEHALNFPEDGLYVTEDFFARNPAVACKFVRASIEGWQYSFNHRDEALAIVRQYMDKAGVSSSRVHQEWMLDRMQDLISPASTGSALHSSVGTSGRKEDNTDSDRAMMGQLQESDFERVRAVLSEAGMLSSLPTFESFYRPCIANVQE